MSSHNGLAVHAEVFFVHAAAVYCVMSIGGVVWHVAARLPAMHHTSKQFPAASYCPIHDPPRLVLAFHLATVYSGPSRSLVVSCSARVYFDIWQRRQATCIGAWTAITA